MVRTYHQNVNSSSLGGTFGGGGDEPKYGRRASTIRSELAVSDLDSLSSPFVTSFSKRSPDISNRQLSGINNRGLSEKDQNTSILCCDHCTLKAHTPRSPFGNPGTTLVPYVAKSMPGTNSPGNVFILPTIPQYQVAPSGLSFGGLDLGLCQGCQHVYGHNQKKNGPHGSMDFEVQSQSKSLRGDPGGSSGLKSSTSDGYLSRNTRSHSLPRDSYDDFDMRMGLTELTGTLQRLQNVTDDNTMDENDYSVGHYIPEPGTSLPLELDDFARKSWSAPQDTHNYGGSGDFFRGQNNFDSPRTQQQQHSIPNHHRYQQQQPPLEPTAQNNRRRGQGPPSKSAYRRELEQQMKEQQARKDRENKQIRAEKFGIDHDPMDHLRNGTTKSDRSGGYSPSLIEGQQRRARRGGNEPPPVQTGGSKADMVMQMAEERARRERDKKDDGRDWWEKRAEPDHFGDSPKKPHPAQEKPTRAKQHPKQDRMSYEDELKAQIEDRKRRDEEEKRKEREEDEKLERRLREQQEKMNAEIQEEKARKRQKEEANLKRQEEMSRKKRELEAQVEKARKEAAELKFKEKKAAAKAASQVAREQTPSPEPPEDFVPFRSDSPPIPAMRGKMRPPSNGPSNGDSEVIANQLSTMRQQLDRQQEEHDSVWNGLVEV